MNLKNILENKRTFLIIGLITAIFLGVWAWREYGGASIAIPGYELATPEVATTTTTPVELEGTNYSSRMRANPEIDFSNIPKDGFVYSYEDTKLDEPLISSIIQNLNLSLLGNNTNPVTGRTIKAGRDNIYLIGYLDNGYLEYSNYGFELAPVTKTDEQLQTAIQNFATTLSVDTSHFALVKKTYFRQEKDTPHADVVQDKLQANIAEYYFESKIGDNDMIDSKNTATPNYLRVQITNSLNILKFHAEYTGTYSDNPIGKLKLKDKETVIQEINQGKAVLLSGSVRFADSEPKLITVNEIALAYKADGDKLFPVYRLNAEVINMDNTKSTGFLLLDAIENE